MTAPTGRCLEKVKNFLPLDDGDRVVLLVEQLHDGVHDVIQGSGQGMYVFTIEQRDKRAVELVDDTARAAIARVLDFPDCIDRCHVRRVRCQYLLQQARSAPDVTGETDEFLEETSLLWEDIESEHVTSSVSR